MYKLSSRGKTFRENKEGKYSREKGKKKQTPPMLKEREKGCATAISLHLAWGADERKEKKKKKKKKKKEKRKKKKKKKEKTHLLSPCTERRQPQKHKKKEHKHGGGGGGGGVSYRGRTGEVACMDCRDQLAKKPQVWGGRRKRKKKQL